MNGFGQAYTFYIEATYVKDFVVLTYETKFLSW